MSVARAAGIRPGEGRVLGLVALLFAALEAGRGFGEVGVDTLVVGRFGAGTLPYLFIGLGATSLVTALAFGAALGRLPRTPLLAGVLLTAAGLLFAGLAAAMGTADVIPLIWLVTYASGAIGGTISWTVAGSVFDVRQAKRLFPLCTGAAIAGSFVGTLGAGPVARFAGTEALVAIEAALLLTVAGVIVAISRTGQVHLPVRSRDRSVIADLRIGFDEVIRLPLFRLTVIAYLLFAVLNFSVTFPFLQVAAATFPSEADLATAIGLLSAGVTATSFILSLAVANRIYARFGVASATLILPLVYVVGFGIWLVQFSFATAAVVRFAQLTTQRGLSNAAWSAFYNVVPGDRRAQVVAFIDGVPGQIGTILSGLLLLGAGTLFAAEQLFWVGAITAVGLTIVVLGVRRQYGASLLRTLRAGLAEQVLEGGPGLAVLGGDPQVTSALLAAAQAPEPAVREMAVGLLGRFGTVTAREVLLERLTDDAPGVRSAAVVSIAQAKAPGTRELILERLGDPDDRVRSSAVLALGSLHEHGLEEALAPLESDASVAVRTARVVALDDHGAADGGISRLLLDPAPEVREATIKAVAAVGGLHEGATIASALVTALDDDSPGVRRTASTLLSMRDADTEGVIELLESGSSRAQDAALRALLGHGAAVREPLVTWAEVQIGRATEYRAARLALEEREVRTGDGIASFLLFILGRRERLLIERALGALAVLGAPEASGVLRRCLRAADPETRAQALEALDSIGERRLRRAVVGLLDTTAPPPGATQTSALDQLSDDDDPWIRRLARLHLEPGAVPSDMADTARTLTDIEIMIVLRGVPLFGELEPEDLQRIAGTCSERLYSPGEILMREGELGDELAVIVLGGVRVVRAEPDGSERFIRRYQAGDHIGELAVLRERPRAATVIAEEDGARVLVIGGEGLKSILRERPEAAMAMLSTLAERISVQ